MTVRDQIQAYLAAQPDAKRADLEALHALILDLMPGCRLWFLDGMDETGKIVTNPNIGYGFQTMKLAKGKTRDFYQVGLSANTTGISVYLMGLEDKTCLARTYGKELGKASVTGYCIKFRSLEGINLPVLQAAIQDGVAQTTPRP
ncbi:MAG: DUF1801 domain-containing protein [Holophagaceae bacterium]